MGKGKDLGGREPPLERRGSLPPNLPLSPRTSPKSTRLYMAKSCFALYGTGALGGSFLFRAGGDFLKVRLSRLFCEWGAYGVCVFCKCRLIPPHQSLARQTACSFLPPKGSLLRDFFRTMRQRMRRAYTPALIRRLRRHLPPRRGRLPLVLQAI